MKLILNIGNDFLSDLSIDFSYFGYEYHPRITSSHTQDKYHPAEVIDFLCYAMYFPSGEYENRYRFDVLEQYRGLRLRLKADICGSNLEVERHIFADPPLTQEQFKLRKFFDDYFRLVKTRPTSQRDPIDKLLIIAYL